MSQTRKISIALYSDDKTVRKAVVAALGSRTATDLPEHEIHQFATADAFRLFVDSKGPESDSPIDLYILDGEATPEGGLGVARQLKDEQFNCAPVLALLGRKEDRWLAAWSRAEASVIHPIDPFTLAGTVAELLRTRIAASA